MSENDPMQDFFDDAVRLLMNKERTKEVRLLFLHLWEIADEIDTCDPDRLRDYLHHVASINGLSHDVIDEMENKQ